MESNAMIKVLLLSVVAGGIGLAFYSPAFRVKALQVSEKWAGWTTDAQKADPAGYIEHVRGRLRGDLAAMRDSFAQLRLEQERLSVLAATKQRQLADSSRMLESCRSAWQAGVFPATVFGQSYTSEQLQAQVALLLEEQSGYELGVQRIREAEQAAVERIRELTVQQDRTGTSLSLLDTQKELLVSRGLQTSGDDLTASVDLLLHDNQQVLSSGPVRPLEELVASEKTPAASASTSMARVMEYLRNGLPGAGSVNVSSTGSY